MTVNMKVIISNTIRGERELVKHYEKELNFPVPAENFNFSCTPIWFEDDDLEIELVHESLPKLKKKDMLRYLDIWAECTYDAEEHLPGAPKSISAVFSDDYRPYFEMRCRLIHQQIYKKQMAKPTWKQWLLAILFVVVFGLVACITLIEQATVMRTYLFAAGIAILTLKVEYMLYRIMKDTDTTGAFTVNPWNEDFWKESV